jgi:hypothetical protein
LLLGTLLNGRVLRLQPQLNLFGVLLISLLQRFLGRQTPPFEILSHRPNWHLHPTHLLNQTANCLAMTPGYGERQDKPQYQQIAFLGFATELLAVVDSSESSDLEIGHRVFPYFHPNVFTLPSASSHIAGLISSTIRSLGKEGATNTSPP